MSLARTAAPAAALVLALAACGTDPAADDSPGPDAIEGPGTVMDVTCVEHRATARFADGRRNEYIYRTATFDVGPDDVYAVEFCTAHGFADGCPTGATCTGDFGPAIRPACHRSFRSGSFVDGKLVVNCGRVVGEYNATGQLVGGGTFNYWESAKVIVY